VCVDGFLWISDLSNNQLTSLDVELFCGLGNLLTLKLEGNPGEFNVDEYLAAAKKPCTALI
jgi:hypothetical protein